jgi:hypothetical protein
MIAWPNYNGKPLGTVLRSSSWDTATGIIADATRSGKYKSRADHIKTPDAFNITMHMTLDQYRVFKAWWENTDRKGVYTFTYPRINDNTGELVEYQFVSDSRISIQNTSAFNIEVSMQWMEAN